MSIPSLAHLPKRLGHPHQKQAVGNDLDFRLRKMPSGAVGEITNPRVQQRLAAHDVQYAQLAPQQQRQPVHVADKGVEVREYGFPDERGENAAAGAIEIAMIRNVNLKQFQRTLRRKPARLILGALRVRDFGGQSLQKICS
jgi:hypothetical protein